MRWSRGFSVVGALAGAIVAVQACSSSGDSGAPTGTTPSISLSITPASTSITAGALAAVVASVTRSGGFTGAVTITVEGAPTGITASVAQTAPVGNLIGATISFTSLTIVAAGSYSLTIRAKGAGVSDATAALTISVTSGVADFGLFFIPATLSIPAGGKDSVLALTARLGTFAGTITLTQQSAAAGITATFNPTSTTGLNGNQVRMTVNVAATVAPGSYNVVIRGSSPGQPDQTATLPLQVAPGTGGGNVALDLSQCLPLRVLWVAGQDGTGAWTRLTGANELYRFNVTSGKGGVAWVTDFANAQSLHIYYGSQSELTAATLTPCRLLGTRLISGTATGLVANEFVSSSLGGDHTVSTQAAPGFTFSGVRDGVHDLIATRWNAIEATPQREIIRRDVSITGNGSLAALDFSATSTTAFAPQPALITMNNVLAGETLLMATGYLTGANCDIGLVRSFGTPTGTGTVRTTTALGIPAAQQRANDYHEFAVTTSSDNLFILMADIPQFGGGFLSGNAGRTLRVFYHTHADRAVAFGDRMLVDPTITKLTAAYKRLQASFTNPAGYETSATFEYGTQGNGPQVSITATRAWLGTAGTIDTPDFTGVSGFNTAWPPAPTQQTPWSVTLMGTNITGSQCTEGAFIRTERRVGFIQ